MTLDEHIKATEHLLVCQKAFRDGKAILFAGERMSEEPTWGAVARCYSIAPEPKIRPWKPAEIPVGAVIRRKDGSGVKSIVRPVVGPDKEIMADHFEWCWPHEQFDESKWKPCGVVEP